MSDVLLVNPPMWAPPAHSGFNAICPPLGLGYLAAGLLREGASVEILDLAVSGDPDADLRRAVDSGKPRMVGITGVTQNIHRTYRLARAIRALAPEATIAVGGPHVTYEWKEALSVPEIDCVAFHESERTIVDLFHQAAGKRDFAKVKGVAYRAGETPTCTAERAQGGSLDELAFPARHLLPMSRYLRPGTMLSSRGCPYKCIFCLSSTYEGRYRMRGADNVLEELEQLRRVWGQREVYFFDNVFTVDAKRVQRICQGIRERRLDIEFHCVCRLDLITREMVAMLRSAGCRRMEIGVESGDQGVIDAVDKHITVQQVFDAADLVLGGGLIPMFTFQIGSPFDTATSLEKTHQTAARLRAKGATTFFSVMTPYPGTPLRERAGELGIDIHARGWEEFRTSNPLYDTRHLDRQTFRRALFREAEATSVM